MFSCLARPWQGGGEALADSDGDGFDACGPGEFFDCDCDPSDIGIHPAATEKPDDGDDDDCDLADGIHLEIWEDMNDWSGDPPSSAWSTDGIKAADAVVLGPGEVLTWTGSRQVRFGRLHVSIDAGSAPGGADGTCDVELTTAPIGGGPSSTATATLLEGSFAYSLSDPEVKVLEIQVDCAGATGDVAAIDWLVLQNSDIPFAPPEDLDLTWWDTDMPEGGYDTSTVLRGGELCDEPCEPVYETLLAACDVGGFGMWDEAEEEWVSINGDTTGSSFLYQDVDIDAYDIGWVDDGSTDGLLLGITGSGPDDELRGQLLASSDLGQSWTPLANGHSSSSSDPAVAANRRVHPWGTTDRPGGRLIQPTGTGQAFIASQVEGEPALVLRDGSGSLCAVGEGTLPEASDWASGTPEDVLVALSWMPDEVGSGGAQIVLAGYRQRDLTTTSSDEQALFRCTYSAEPTCSATPTCAAIDASEGIDVADIEVVQSSDGSVQAYVADFGRRARNDGGSSPDTSNCLDSSETPSAGDTCGPRVWRWDVDRSTPDGSADTIQDLVTPSSIKPAGLTFTGRTPQPVHGLNLSPSDVWLTAFTPNGHAGWYSSDAPAWRISVCEAKGITDSGYPSGCTTSAEPGWISLSDDKYLDPGYTSYDASDPSTGTDRDMDGEVLRESELNTGSTWMADQTLTAWRAEMRDGVYYQEDGSSPRLLVGNAPFGFWAWHVNSSSAYGPESYDLDGADVATVDEDTAIGSTFYDNAGDTGSTTYQGTVVRDVRLGWDMRAWVTDMDNGFVYEEDGSATRAVRPSQLSTFGAGGMAVATAEVQAGDDGAVWVALYDKATTDGPPYRQGILRSEDSGDTFCYQGVIEEGAEDVEDHGARHRSIDAVAKTKYVPDQVDELFHRKEYTHPDWPGVPGFGTEDWVPCDNGVIGDPMDEGIAFREGMTLEGTPHDMSWGNPLDIVALDEHLAIATFASYDADQDLLGNSFTSTQSIPGRVGYTLDGGETWQEVDFSDAAADATCTAVTDLQHDLFGKLAHLVLVPDGTWHTSDEDWGLDFFVLGEDSGDLYSSGGHDCALWRVTLETTAGPVTTTDWEPVSIPYGGTEDCTVYKPTGVARAPWQDRLMIWGAYSKVSAGSDAYDERGGLCLMDFDGGDPVSVLDPADGYRFTIKELVPNPLVQDNWLVSPFVDHLTQDQCARQRSGGAWTTDGEDLYDACDLPIPFVLQRRPPGAPGPDWVTTDLGIDGLHSLQGTQLDVAASYVQFASGVVIVGMQVLYGTTGTGAFRGVVSW